MLYIYECDDCDHVFVHHIMIYMMTMRKLIYSNNKFKKYRILCKVVMKIEMFLKCKQQQVF